MGAAGAGVAVTARDGHSATGQRGSRPMTCSFVLLLILLETCKFLDHTCMTHSFGIVLIGHRHMYHSWILYSFCIIRLM